MKTGFDPNKEAKSRMKLYSSHVHGYEKREAAKAARIETSKRIQDYYRIASMHNVCNRVRKKCLKKIDQLMLLDKELKKKERKN